MWLVQMESVAELELAAKRAMAGISLSMLTESGKESVASMMSGKGSAVGGQEGNEEWQGHCCL